MPSAEARKGHQVSAMCMGSCSWSSAAAAFLVGFRDSTKSLSPVRILGSMGSMVRAAGACAGPQPTNIAMLAHSIIPLLMVLIRKIRKLGLVCSCDHVLLLQARGLPLQCHPHLAPPTGC